ncbi:hypothetical protein K4F52_000878 [Lecanicillium sp. MT-2017a]|nr:hypothetical protein K4F52_000878 [Lecanicillium sp. MT-2017a]
MATATWTPDAEQWTLAEDEYFWCQLVPRSKWGTGEEADPSYDETEVANAMRQKFANLKLRPYTAWSITTKESETATREKS